jgi:ABC-2 type transport system permease protein
MAEASVSRSQGTPVPVPPAAGPAGHTGHPDAETAAGTGQAAPAAPASSARPASQVAQGSTAESAALAGLTGYAGRTGGLRAWLRFFRSELRLVFRRRRNLLLLGVVATFPILIGIGLRVAAHPEGGGGNGGLQYISQLAGNGVFLTFISLTVLLTLVMPVVVAVVAGDSIAGEAGYGTLRYLLAVPAGRTRLLAVKYSVIVVFALAVTVVVTAVALATGAALFPVGPVTLLSGTTVSLADGILRLVFVTLYVAAAMAMLGAIGLAISTLTEHAIGAIAALAILVVASEVSDQVQQFAVIHPYLPTHWWPMFDSLLRVPADTTTLWHGLLSFAVYLVIFGSFAWARFSNADVTS